MTNNDDDIIITLSSTFGIESIKRPPANFSDITFESRGIEKIAEEVRDMAREFYIELIDTEYPEHADDEVVDDFLEKREGEIIKMICIQLLGSDRIAS